MGIHETIQGILVVFSLFVLTSYLAYVKLFKLILAHLIGAWDFYSLLLHGLLYMEP